MKEQEDINVKQEKDSVFEENIIRERTIDDAWRSAMWCCIRKGYRYVIEKGSYEGQERLQLENTMIIIEEPWTRPLSVTVPELLGFTSPTSEDKIHSYFFEYLASGEKEETEDYTYGQYIVEQWDRAVDLLAESEGKTNQCCITIGDEKSIYLNDPPCLRNISFKAIPTKDGFQKLQMSVFFRSWDLFAGLPENLGGMQLLKEKMIIDLENKGFIIEDGPIVAYSDGLHIYQQFFPLVNQLNANKVVIEEEKED